MDLRAVRRHVAALGLALGLLAAWTTPALGQGVPGVLVVRAAPAESERARALEERILDGALEDDRDLAPVPPPLARPLEDGWLGRAVLAAEDQFARFDLPSAAGTIEDARARLDRDGPGGVSTAELVELFLLATRIAHAREDAEGARAAVHRALAIDPDLVVDPERHPPTTTVLVDAERTSVVRCPVVLVLTPSEATVSIDGRAAAPVASTLPCGEHYLSASAPGYLEAALHFTASSSGGPTELELRLDPGAALVLPSLPFSEASALERRAARSLGRELVFLDLLRDGDALLVALGERRIRAPGGATVDQLVLLLRAAGRTEGGLDVGVVVGVSIGAAVALAAAITAIVLVASAPPPTGFELRGQILP